MNLNLKTLFALILLVQSNFSFGQKYRDFAFTESPNALLKEYMKTEDDVILKKTYSLEYRFEKEQLVIYEYSHVLRWVNSDIAIEKNNKIYVSKSDDSKTKYNKVKVLSPNGNSTFLKDKDIKEGTDPKSDNKFYYFAIEGLEKGSFLEIISYRIIPAQIYGSMTYLQGNEKRYNQVFEIICPTHLFFAFKCLNNTPDAIFDTTLTNVNRWTITVDSVEAIKKQTHFYENNVKQSVVYKLNVNKANNKKDISSYGLASENISKNLHPTFTKNADKAVKKVFKSFNFKENDTEIYKIKSIENYVKEHYQIIDNDAKQLSDIEFILQNKAANESGITILHIALLKLANIEHEIVLTSDRSNLRFDPKFEAFLYLQNYVLFFPKLKLYLAPTEKFFRLGFIPGLWTHNYGLFIKKVKVGDFESAIGKIKFIDALPYTESKDEMNVNVDFSKNILSPTINFKRKSTGYYAQNWQPYFANLNEEFTDDLKKTLVKVINDKIETDSVILTNIGEHDFGDKPFILEFSTVKHPFIEKAGNNVLFKVGELIGPQVEMYQESERIYDVENSNNRIYERIITFNIPEGYEIKNLDDININIQYGEVQNPTHAFISTYTINNNQVKINCKEFYNKIIFPVSEFEYYRNVINAAADFNKVVFVLKKKE